MGHYRKELEVAVSAVRAAARVCETVQANLVSDDTIQKRDRSPVTVADFASQAVVAAILTETFGEDAVVGEEQADALRGDEQVTLRQAVVRHVCNELRSNLAELEVLALIDHCGHSAATGDRYWTLDPIDGTKGFIRGGQYAVALSLIESGQVVLGVLGCPNLELGSGQGALLVAARGHGASQTPLKEQVSPATIRVSELAEPRLARFCESVESGHSNQGGAASVANTLGITTPPLRMDSQAKYASVARGDAQIYLRLPTRGDYRECIWDHAAGMIVVHEAGGRVTDIRGQPLDFTHGRRLEMNQGIVATNGPFHDRTVEAVGKVLAD